MAEKLTGADVHAWLKSKDTPADAAELAMVVAATVDYVDGLPVVRDSANPAVWSASVKLGAAMLAARLFRRRNSPAGIEGMTEAGTSYVARHDPDVSRLLKLDGSTAPAVG
jgi:hypothetical protein